jgi:hypothetical protein
VSAVAVRIICRLLLLLLSLAAATAILVGGLSLLASVEPAGVAPLMAHDSVAMMEEATMARPEVPTDATPTPRAVLVFAGIVFLAALPPIQRIHVYHRSDWA